MLGAGELQRVAVPELSYVLGVDRSELFVDKVRSFTYIFSIFLYSQNLQNIHVVVMLVMDSCPDLFVADGYVFAFRSAYGEGEIVCECGRV